MCALSRPPRGRQPCRSCGRRGGGSRSIEHLGSANDEVELAALNAAAAERLAAGQAVLDLGMAGPPGSEPLPITSSQMTHLWDGLCAAYRVLGFESVTKGDTVFRDLVLARIIEPTSKIDAGRVLSEVGVEPASCASVKRRLPVYAQPGWRQSLAAVCAQHAGLGPASLVMFDVSTLYFETDAGDGFREPGFQGTPPGTPDHPGSAHRRDRVPADCGRLRGQTGPRPPRCCRSSTPSNPHTNSPTSPWSPMRG